MHLNYMIQVVISLPKIRTIRICQSKRLIKKWYIFFITGAIHSSRIHQGECRQTESCKEGTRCYQIGPEAVAWVLYTNRIIHQHLCPTKTRKTPRPQADKEKMELLLGMYSNLIVTSPLKIIVRSLGPDPHEKRKWGSGSPYTQSKVSITSAVWLSMQLAMWLVEQILFSFSLRSEYKTEYALCIILVANCSYICTSNIIILLYFQATTSVYVQKFTINLRQAVLGRIYAGPLWVTEIS